MGKALLNYVEPSSPESNAQNRRALVEAIALVLESKKRQTRVEGIEALLEAFEGRITPVARKVEMVALFTMPVR